ncbi:hypothetical protein D3C80_1850550 [compost metagenome]
MRSFFVMVMLGARLPSIGLANADCLPSPSGDKVSSSLIPPLAPPVVPSDGRFLPDDPGVVPGADVLLAALGVDDFEGRKPANIL